jgi:hypothetical protein
MSNDARRFSDEEFALVLRKAIELQDGAGPRPHSPDGLSLEEMKAVARDVGIDPALVERAAAFLPDGRMSGFDRITGGPTRYRLEHSGTASRTKEDFAEILDLIRRETGHHGKVTSELDGITWATEGEVSQFHVSLSPRTDSTEVRVTVNRDAAFVLTWFFSVAGAFVAAGITGAVGQPETVVGGFAIMGTALGAGLTLARTLWTRSSRVVRDRTHRLMELLAREVDAGSSD